MLDFHCNTLRTLVRLISDRTTNALYTYLYVIIIHPSRFNNRGMSRGAFYMSRYNKRGIYKGHSETVPSASWHFVKLSRECPD